MNHLSENWISAFLERLLSHSLLKKENETLTLSPVGILLEDLVYASFFPGEMWEEFSQKRKESAYTSLGGKYDWFFEPETVLKFQNFLKGR